MKFTKRFIAVALIAVFSLSACKKDEGVVQDAPTPVEAEKPADETEKPTETEPVKEAEEKELADMTQAEIVAMCADFPAATGTIIRGSSTEMNSDYFDGWTNISPNADYKRAMFYDASLVVGTVNEEFVVNNVFVKEFEATPNADGSKTFRFVLYDNLVYNDGSPIKAQDYLFRIMVASSAQFGEIDGSPTNGIRFAGYEQFNKGYLINEEKLAVDADGNVIEVVTKDADGKDVSEFTAEVVPTKTFTGLRLLGDYEMEITVDKEELPFFYELSYFYGQFPIPMAVLAPDVTITDDGNGATFSDNFTTDLIRETFMNPETGYRYAPMVTPGPYQFESFDNTTYTAIITANPNFLATYDGFKPRIQKIITKFITQATMMNELEAGTIDLVAGVATGSNIDNGLELVDQGIVDYAAYPRNGYGLIAFHCDFGPTQFQAVRQALCYLLDRDEFGRQYSGGYAIVVDSRYSESQWTYQEAKDVLESKLIKYTLNTDKAEELLIDDGWTLNETGGDYVAGAGKVRHKMVDGELMPLVIQWCSSKDNAVSDLLAIMMPPEAEKIGLKIEQTIQTSVLDTYYRKGIDEPFFHMFNMGTGFAIPDSPWNSYSRDPRFMGSPYNNNYILSEKLESLTQAMKKTDPEDRDGFLAKWTEYVVQWNQELPDIPLYANIYHDFYSPKINGYEPNPTWAFWNTMIRSYIEE